MANQLGSVELFCQNRLNDLPAVERFLAMTDLVFDLEHSEIMQLEDNSRTQNTDSRAKHVVVPPSATGANPCTHLSSGLGSVGMCRDRATTFDGVCRPKVTSSMISRGSRAIRISLFGESTKICKPELSKNRLIAGGTGEGEIKPTVQRR